MLKIYRILHFAFCILHFSPHIRISSNEEKTKVGIFYGNKD